jgi:zinc transport system substrate-binding protein
LTALFLLGGFMNKIHRAFTIFLVFCLLISLLLGGCTGNTTTKIKIVTSTSLLACITQQVGGNIVEVINLIPPSQHPGDFNVRPGDVEKLATAKLFLLHGWPGEQYADKFIAAANNANLIVFKANVNGNWMIPTFQSAATDKVAGILGQIDVTNNATFTKSAEEYKHRISSKEADIKSRLTKANISQINVMASGMQADFLKWAGLNVIASYGQPETLTPQIVKELVDKGKSGKVTLIVDNLQNGKDAGKSIAQELGAKQINLSNFPGGFDNTETWEKAITYNIDLLINAVSK